MGGEEFILDGLKTNVKTGLMGDPEALELRRTAFGTNALNKKDPKTFMEIVCETLDDFVMKILIGCAVVNLLIALTKYAEPDHMLMEMIDGTAILCAVAICTLVAAINDYKKEQ